MFTHSSRHSAIPNERILKMGSPRPVEGRARNYGYKGSSSDGRLGPQMGGFNHSNSYRLGLDLEKIIITLI